MNKEQIDKLLQNVWFDCFHKTVESCRKEWEIDLKGKDKDLLYPVIPPFPDTQDEVIKVVLSEKDIA